MVMLTECGPSKPCNGCVTYCGQDAMSCMPSIQSVFYVPDDSDLSSHIHNKRFLPVLAVQPGCF